VRNIALFYLFILSGVFNSIKAQNGYTINSSWGDYNKGTSTISFDLQFMEDTLYTSQLTLFVTVNISLPNCDSKTFPTTEQSKKLKDFQYSLYDHLEIYPKGLIVGSETSTCRQKLFIYLKDTTGIMDEIRILSKKESYTKWTIKTTTEQSNHLEYYMNHLVPKDISYEELFMEKMYESLKKDGDKLIASRNITHSFDISVSNYENIQTLIGYLNSEGYTTELKSGGKLWATKSESADPAVLLPSLRKLRAKSKELNTPYSGISIVQLKN
jgi:hypothetical protein